MQFSPSYTPELELPRIEDATATLKDSFLAAANYAAPFSFLVAVLVGIERMPASPRRADLFYDIGRAFNGFGNGDDELGLKFMSAAGQAAQTLYGEKMWDLNTAWNHIGRWRA